MEPKQPFKKSRAKQPLRKVVPKMFGSTFFERWIKVDKGGIEINLYLIDQPLSHFVSVLVVRLNNQLTIGFFVVVVPIVQ